MRLDEKETMAYDYDIVVIGGGPAGYAAAIRAAQLKKRTLCIEKDKLGGICLNWGCIPTKALLTNAHLVELIKNHGTQFGYSGEPTWDFAQMIKRSRSVAGQLNKGIEGLFKKYKVASKFGVAKVITPHIVQVNGEAVSAESIVLATGVRPRPLPGAEYDGKTIISYKEAMSLPTRPQSMLIIGGGPIGLEFGYFYNAIGTKVTVVELLDRILPGEDDEVSAVVAEEPHQARADDPDRHQDDQARQDRHGDQGRARDAQGKGHGRGRRHARGHRRSRQCRGARRRRPQAGDRQEPHQGRPQERLRRPACRASTRSAT